MKLKPGDRVMIYHDPETKQKPEGEATLMRLWYQIEEGEHWQVRFEDGSVANRWIYA
jgi:hypothetical protein